MTILFSSDCRTLSPAIVAASSLSGESMENYTSESFLLIPSSHLCLDFMNFTFLSLILSLFQCFVSNRKHLKYVLESWICLIINILFV